MKISLGASEVVYSNNHRFFVNGQWLMAKDLQAGAGLLSPGAESTTVRETCKLAGAQKVYNIGVEKNRNYFITNDKVLGHNAKTLPYATLVL